ncbi:PASTA domain-containing protein [Acidicapsa dinghuensis]|uniref:PASTA domain-containing protein n=1 Tax=Acidicapsa dinghuensis TaxID=2218256 RepID=A0ABW1ENE0_9BACT|nr:PASTA domain-containing protein [Acidicapsa dinghuensis]
MLFAALVLVALASAVLTMQFAIHGAEVHVPNLRGMTIAEAHSQTAGLRLNLEVDNHYYSSEVAAGHILTQSPAPNSVVRRDWHVRVADSLGPQKVEVPNTVGLQERVAGLNLRHSSLEEGTPSQLPWSASDPGTVLAQDPQAKAQGIEKPSVNLLVAAPDDAHADGFVMPDLSGLPILTAQALLTHVGIKFDAPKFQDVPIPSVSGTVVPLPASPTAAPPVPAPIHPSAPPGAVIAQSPPAGFKVDVGSTVSLTVAK